MVDLGLLRGGATWYNTLHTSKPDDDAPPAGNSSHLDTPRCFDRAVLRQTGFHLLNKAQRTLNDGMLCDMPLLLPP